MACCDITAGMLNKSVSFERKDTVADGAGGFTSTWVPFKSAYAKIEALGGGERWASDRTEAVSKYRVTVRYFADLYESDVVVFRGRQHNITHIKNVDLADKWLIISVDGGMAV